MDAFRGLIADFSKAEEELLVVRSASLESTLTGNTYTLVIGGLGLLGLTLVLGYVFTEMDPVLLLSADGMEGAQRIFS
jgi:hypothetical protein